MVVIDIFAVVEGSLYTVQFEGEEQDEFEKIFSNWNDPVYLNEFFNKHSADLQSGFFGPVTIQQAIDRTWQEAQDLEDLLYDLAENGQNGHHENLSHLFQPLTRGETGRPLEKDKAYGSSSRSWLRIYAIRIAANVFVICGGAIKLTETMNDREHLINELLKLDVTRKYLKSDNEWADFFYELTL